MDKFDWKLTFRVPMSKANDDTEKDAHTWLDLDFLQGVTFDDLPPGVTVRWESSPRKFEDEKDDR